MDNKKLPLQLENPFLSLYGNFGSRFAALLLDGLILSPLIIGILIFNSMRMNNYYFTFFTYQLLVLAYSIYLPVRYGATPGKRILDLTILKIDGTAIGYRESFLKVFPMLVLGLMGFAFHSYQLSQIDEDTFNTLSWLAQSNYIRSYSPGLMTVEIVISFGFYFTNLIVFLLNDRKRSIGDLLAGTVVVYTRNLDKINAIDTPAPLEIIQEHS